MIEAHVEFRGDADGRFGGGFDVGEEGGLGEGDGADGVVELAGEEANGGVADGEFGDGFGLDAVVAGLNVLLSDGEAGPDLDAVDDGVDVGLFGVDDAAACGDPLGAAGADAVFVAEGVAVDLGAFEEVRDDFDASVGVGGDAAPNFHGGGAEVIEEDEGADVAAFGLGEGAEDGEIADGGGVGAEGLDDGTHGGILAASQCGPIWYALDCAAA